jgi:hypothetical protein
MILTRIGLARSAALVLALVHADRSIQAVCPSPAPPCEALQNASTVILAEVSDTASGATISPNPLPPQIVRLRVVERFKGGDTSEEVRQLRQCDKQGRRLS